MRLLAPLAAALALAAATLAASAPAAPPFRLAAVFDVTSGPREGACFVAGGPAADGSTGSVARALLETLAREHEILYGYLRQVYDSAFVETGSGGALGGVLSIVDLTATPRALLQADVSVLPGVGRLSVETDVRDPTESDGAAPLPDLETCTTFRPGGTERD